MKCNIKNLKRYSNRRDSLDTCGATYLWAFNGRLHHSNMNLIEAVKGLVQGLWDENTRHSSNQKYVLKMRN
jgi:hypothetical protein